MIIKSGKRIDGCTDTVPVGTIQPFLGLVPPSGYLVCQGQKVSKTTYPKLYEICGDLFGKSTEGEFYLPDLRGKTIVGYDADNGVLNTLGALIGAATHTHTSAAHVHSVDGHTHTSAAHTHSIAGHTHSTGNHTLTVAEMPKHEHSVYADAWAGKLAVKMTQREQTSADGNTYDVADFGHDTSSQSGPLYATEAGGSQAHNHGDTGSTSLTSNSTTPGATGSTTLTTKSTTPGDTGSSSNYQPSIAMNWIVKAVMLIPEYFIVENTLTSTNTENALSAAQGKILSDKVDNCLSRSGGTVSGNLISYYHDFLISANEFNFASGSYNNGSIYFNYRAGTSDADKTAGPITNYYFYNGQKEMATNVYAKYFQSSNGTLLGTNNFYVITGTTAAPDSGGNAELMNVPSDVYVISLMPTSKINATIIPYYPGSGYEHWFLHVIKDYNGSGLTSISYAALVYKPS